MVHRPPEEVQHRLRLLREDLAKFVSQLDEIRDDAAELARVPAAVVRSNPMHGIDRLDWALEEMDLTLASDGEIFWLAARVAAVIGDEIQRRAGGGHWKIEDDPNRQFHGQAVFVTPSGVEFDPIGLAMEYVLDPPKRRLREKLEQLMFKFLP